jgi:hypothetical protein
VHEELSHGVGEAGEVGLIHLVGSGKGGVLGADEAYMGQRVDTELVEGVLRLGKLDVGEEEVAGAGVAALNEAASSPNSLRSWGRWRPGLEWCAEASKKTSTEYGRGAGAERKRVTELSVRWITPEGERARRDWSSATRSSAPAVRSRRGRNGSKSRWRCGGGAMADGRICGSGRQQEVERGEGRGGGTVG